MPRLFSAMLLLIGLVGIAAGQESNPLYEKTKKNYTDSFNKARSELLAALDSASKAATAAGDLDVVKTLQTEKEAFETSGKLPTSQPMKSAAANYETTMKRAKTHLEEINIRVTNGLLKAGKRDQAKALRDDMKEFLKKLHSGNNGTERPQVTDVRTKEDLQKYLTGTSWVWGNITFKPDGVIESKDWEGKTVEWDAVDRRTVVLKIVKGRNDGNKYAILTFSDDLSEFRGFDFNGKDRLPAYKQKP